MGAMEPAAMMMWRGMASKLVACARERERAN